MRAQVLVAIAVVALGGCSKILGINDVTIRDGGGDDGGGGIDAPPNTVVGKSFLRCLQVSGAPAVDLTTDLSASIIAAMIPDGSPTGYKVVSGTGSADGTFVIHDVPDGQEYLLKIDRNYWVTTSHVIDDHGEEPFRCDPAIVPTTAPTNLAFSLTNMQPFADDESGLPASVIDGIEIDSLALSYQNSVGGTSKATTYTAAVDWMTGFPFIGGPPGLLDQTLGDDLEVVHTRTEPIVDQGGRPRRFTHVLDTFSATGVKLVNGVASPVAGAFVTATNNQALTFSINRGLFDSGYLPTTEFAGLTVSLVAHPIVNDFASGAMVASVDLTDWTRGTTLTGGANGVAYADPYPATWHRYEVVAYSRFRRYKLPGATKAGIGFGQMTRALEYTGTLTVTPTLVPPSTIKVEGVDFTAGGKVMFDGVAPVTVSWNAVALTKSYSVTVLRVTPNGQGSTATNTATITTTGTSVKIPAEAFSGGQFFVFRLASVTSPADYAGGHLVANGVPSQSTLTPSGLFRLSTTCGNGAVDTGEDCDTTTETAACDVDCSAVSCGDGMRNATAGEQCDTIFDTPGCNATTCKLPTCGDGYLNVQAGEDCDDGNIVDSGNGCSTTCKLNNICGNGVVQNAIGQFGPVEECDTSGVDGVQGGQQCNGATCKFNFCGDGHVNIGAGEQCDDGNQVDGDGCTSTCMNG